MITQIILIPLVVFVLSGGSMPSFFSEDVAGEKTVRKTEEKNAEQAEQKEFTPTPSSSEDTEDESPSGSAVIQEGESSVNIDISNEGSSESRGDNGGLLLQDFMYPGAQVVSESGQSVRLQSNTSHDVISEWYENAIEQEGMNIQSFVRTSSNGKILNKLGGAGNSAEILVEISKDSGSDTTFITVELK